MILRQMRKTSSLPYPPCLTLALLLFFCTALPGVTTAQAQTRYVKPSAEIAVRRGQGNDYKIIAMVKDGATVDLLETEGDYALIRLEDGKQGWVLERFLSDEPPLAEIVAALRTDNEALQRREADSGERFEEMAETLDRTEKEREEFRAERDLLSERFLALERDTADVVQIKNDLLERTRENKLLVEKLATVQQENSEMRKEKTIHWFLAGGGVLVTGMLIGMSFSRSRKRKSTLL